MESIRPPYPPNYQIFPQSDGKDRRKEGMEENKSGQLHSVRKSRQSPKVQTTRSPQCATTGEKQCEDGSCIARVELCPEEQLMNQNTILIMIVVGLAVVVFLVILYCFQQRQRRANQALGTDTALSEDCDNASLYAPPPSYEDVMNSNLYLPASEHRQLQLLSSTDETLTPPPNYDTALILLAQSQDSALNKTKRHSSTFRRSVSLENIFGGGSNNRCSFSRLHENRHSFKEKKKNIFRYSGQFTRTTLSSGNNPSSPRAFQRTLPPYSPPIYPITPPPSITPTPTSVHTQFILPEIGRPVPQTTIPETANESDAIL